MDTAKTHTAASIERYFSEGDAVSGRLALKRHLQQALSLGTAQWALKFRPDIRDSFPLFPFTLHILRSYTVEPLIPMLEALALVYDIDLTVSTGEFNTYAQDVLDTNNVLYREPPDCVYLGILARDLCPGLWGGHYLLTETDGGAELDKAERLLRSLVNQFRKHSSAPLVIQGFEHPPFESRAHAPADINHRGFEQLNNCLEELAGDHPSVYVTRYAGMVSLHGYHRWFDPKKWRQARQPISAALLGEFANSLMHYIVPLALPPAKVIVTDLDHTLWNGVIGEDGLNGIRITEKGKEGGHLQYQILLKQLQKTGFLLSISSKNHHDDAVEALAEHPDMQLRPDDFSCIKANWNSKTSNIHAITHELNIGIDSVIFIDDNPLEREMVARQLPQVTVIELPSESQGYADAVARCARLSKLSLLDEDKHKTRQYAAESERRRNMETAADMTTFLHDLDMKVVVSPVSQINLSRAAQLTNKTNQFNITTRRYGESDLQRMLDMPDRYQTYMARATDRFGEHGWIILGLIEFAGSAAWFDSLLMSCRVLGRGVETAFLSHIVQDLRSRGFRRLHGTILPTLKNSPVREVFKEHHFIRQANIPAVCKSSFPEHQEASFWQLDLMNGRCPSTPDWINISKTH